MVLPRVMHFAAERAGSWRRSLTGEGGCNLRRSNEVLPLMDGETWVLRADLEISGWWKRRSLSGEMVGNLRRSAMVLPLMIGEI
jgi:hypothetical protein